MWAYEARCQQKQWLGVSPLVQSKAHWADFELQDHCAAVEHLLHQAFHFAVQIELGRQCSAAGAAQAELVVGVQA